MLTGIITFRENRWTCQKAAIVIRHIHTYTQLRDVVSQFSCFRKENYVRKCCVKDSSRFVYVPYKDNSDVYEKYVVPLNAFFFNS